MEIGGEGMAEYERGTYHVVSVVRLEFRESCQVEQ